MKATGLVLISDRLTSLEGVDVSWKSLGVSERGVGVGDAWTRAEAKNSRLVESPSEVQEAGEVGRSISSDIFQSEDLYDIKN